MGFKKHTLKRPFVQQKNGAPTFTSTIQFFWCVARNVFESKDLHLKDYSMQIGISVLVGGRGGTHLSHFLNNLLVGCLHIYFFHIMENIAKSNKKEIKCTKRWKGTRRTPRQVEKVGIHGSEIPLMENPKIIRIGRLNPPETTYT